MSKYSIRVRNIEEPLRDPLSLLERKWPVIGSMAVWFGGGLWNLVLRQSILKPVFHYLSY